MSIPFLLTIDDIRAALRQPLPGVRGQALMAPAHRLDPDLYARGARDCRRAAVLFLLYPYAGELTTVLTVRPQDLPDHPGQVAFPGGARDADETVIETALREAEEEVGIDPALVEPIGRLTHIYIPPSHFCIQIVVGYSPALPLFRAAPNEVAEILEVPVAHFFDPANQQAEERMVDGALRRIPFFRVGRHKIWGATAIAIAEFVTLVEDHVARKAPASPAS